MEAYEVILVSAYFIRYIL